MGPLLGPHARTDRTRDTRVAEPRLAAPEDRRPGERQRLTPDAPHNGGRPPPLGTAPNPPAARSPHRACRPRGQCWAPTPTHPRPQHVGDGPQQPAQWVGGRGRGGARPQTPLTTVEGTPPGDALPPPPQRAKQAHQGACCEIGAGLPCPHRPHPGHTGRGTLAAHPRGWAAGGGTAPDTRRLSQQRQATLPGDGPLPTPRHAAPTGHAGQGDSDVPPHPHARAHSTWVVDPNSPPSGRAVGGEGAPDIRRPSQQWKALPRGRSSATPAASDAGPQGRTLWGRCWVSRPSLTAPGTHGSRNPGYPHQRAGGWGRDSV